MGRRGRGSREAEGGEATTTTTTTAAASSSSSFSLPANWRSHVAGLRHSRAALGAALSGGAPGAAVAVSVFEEEGASFSLREQRRRQRRPQQQQQRQLEAAANALRTECLKELLRHSGITDAGRELSERFRAERLGAAIAFVQFRLFLSSSHSSSSSSCSSSCSCSSSSCSSSSSSSSSDDDDDDDDDDEDEEEEQEMEAEAEERRRRRRRREARASAREELEFVEASPAVVAALSFALRGRGGLRGNNDDGNNGNGGGGDDEEVPSVPPSLRLRLARVHERDLPAVTAACSLLARALSGNRELRALEVDGSSLHRSGEGGEAEEEGERPSPPPPASSGIGAGIGGGGGRPPEQRRLWSLVARELGKSLRANDALESLRLTLPRGHLRAEDGRALSEAASGAREARRRAFLSAAHPRCSCSRSLSSSTSFSPLSVLPMDLLVAIAKRGISRGECRVEVVETG